MERYILVDPQGVRLALKPETPITLEIGPMGAAGLTSRGRSISGSSETRYNFGFRCTLAEGDALALKALAQARAAEGMVTEVVVYFLWERHSDLGPQTREAVPDLSIDQVGNIVQYYPVVQGDISVTTELKGLGLGSPAYSVDFQFNEGTIRRP